MMKAQSELRVELHADPDIDAEEMAKLTRRLRGELLDLDVNAVQPAVSGEAPDDAKGVDPLALSALLVQFTDSGILHSLVNVVRSWLGRQQLGSITLTLDGDSLKLRGVSSAEQQQLIDLWVARHAVAR